jgi:hypothetical protein
MAGVAAWIVVGEAFLLWALPSMGIIYLPLAGFLAGAVVIIPYREYLSLEHTTTVGDNWPSPELVASRLLRLKPQLRVLALVPLAVALATEIGFLLMPGSWVDRILPASGLLLAIVFFGWRFVTERRIVANYASSLARIVRFERHQRSRAAVYEYESLVGGTVMGKGGSLAGFSIGMTVPVLYNVSNPHESLPVPDFIFYRIRPELS